MALSLVIIQNPITNNTNKVNTQSRRTMTNCLRKLKWFKSVANEH